MPFKLFPIYIAVNFLGLNDTGMQTRDLQARVNNLSQWVVDSIQARKTTSAATTSASISTPILPTPPQSTPNSAFQLNCAMKYKASPLRVKITQAPDNC